MLIVALLSLPFLYIVLRRPVCAGSRCATPRADPRETALVILGALLGTTIMTGSFVVGDSVHVVDPAGGVRAARPDRRSGHRRRSRGRRRDPRRLAGFADADVDGVLPLTVANASAATVTSPRPRRARRAAARNRFRGGPNVRRRRAPTGISGTTPALGEAAIGADLARELRIGVGDHIEVFAYGASQRLQVSQVLPRRGVAGFWRGDEHTSDNAFVTPGTIAGLLGRGDPALGAPPSRRCSCRIGAACSPAPPRPRPVSRALGIWLGPEKYTLDDGEGLADRTRRPQRQLARADLFVPRHVRGAGRDPVARQHLLHARRRTEVRARACSARWGFDRAWLVGAFATEGWCYALASAVAGTFAGLGLGRAMMAFAAHVRARRVRFGPAPAALRVHLGERAARNGDRLRDRDRRRCCSRASGSAGSTSSVRFVTSPRRRRTARTALVLPRRGAGRVRRTARRARRARHLVRRPGDRAGVHVRRDRATLARHFHAHTSPPRSRPSCCSGASLPYPIALALHSGVGVFMFVAQGLMLVGAAVVLVSQQQSAIGHAVGRVAKRSLPVRLGLAYRSHAGFAPR